MHLSYSLIKGVKVKQIIISLLLITLLGARQSLALIPVKGEMPEQTLSLITQRLASEMVLMNLYHDYTIMEPKLGSAPLHMLVTNIHHIVEELNDFYTIDSRIINIETGESVVGALYGPTESIDDLLSVGMRSISHQLCKVPITKESLDRVKLLILKEPLPEKPITRWKYIDDK